MKKPADCLQAGWVVTDSGKISINQQDGDPAVATR